MIGCLDNMALVDWTVYEPGFFCYSIIKISNDLTQNLLKNKSSFDVDWCASFILLVIEFIVPKYLLSIFRFSPKKERKCIFSLFFLFPEFLFVSNLVGKCYAEHIYFVAVSWRDEVKGRLWRHIIASCSRSIITIFFGIMNATGGGSRPIIWRRHITNRYNK